MNVVQNIVFAILIALLGIPCGFKINYLKLYGQVRWNRIAITFFAIQGLIVAAVALAFTGLQNWGCMGLFTTLTMSSTQVSKFGIFAIWVCTGFWGLCVAWQLFLFGKIVLFFKVTGIQMPQGHSI
jgi:hypothetical protein